jgi:hypothetical protein
VCTHPDYRRTEISDVYSIEPKQRGELRILMSHGRTVKGRVISATGERVGGVDVEANFAETKK